jgi:hypothetical protein
MTVLKPVVLVFRRVGVWHTGETQAWVSLDPTWVRRDPCLGLARPTQGLAVSIAMGPAVSVTVGHSLSNLRWMIWVDILSYGFDYCYQVFWSYFLKMK